jgi:predicted nucleic acid-binding protein
MKIFLDANVLVAVLNKEYPLFTTAARILSLSGQKGYEVYTSPMCLAIAFYFSEKKSGSQLARKKISVLAQNLKIAPNLESGVLETISNPKIHDFEDGLEYYSALDAGCQVIVTEDTGDFWFSDIRVLDCQGFIEQVHTLQNQVLL